MDSQITISETVEYTCAHCGQNYSKQEFPVEYSYDLSKIVKNVNTMLLVYHLLAFTENQSYVDFDSFRGMYGNGLEVLGYETSTFGLEVGLLDHYEDECYWVNEEVWQKLHRKMTQIFIFHNPTV